MNARARRLRRIRRRNRLESLQERYQSAQRTAGDTDDRYRKLFNSLDNIFVDEEEQRFRRVEKKVAEAWRKSEAAMKACTVLRTRLWAARCLREGMTRSEVVLGAIAAQRVVEQMKTGWLIPRLFCPAGTETSIGNRLYPLPKESP